MNKPFHMQEPLPKELYDKLFATMEYKEDGWPQENGNITPPYRIHFEDLEMHLYFYTQKEVEDFLNAK